MSNKYVQRARSVLLDEIRKAVFGQKNVIITVENDGPNVVFFMRALELVEIQQELNKRGLKAELRIINPIQKTKEFLLNFLKQAGPEVRDIGFPCYSKDADVYYKALNLPEVKGEFERRRITPHVQIVDKGSEIIIASHDDIVSGNLDVYF